MKVKPVEMGLEFEGIQREIPDMLRRVAEHAETYGYTVEYVSIHSRLDSACEDMETRLTASFGEPNGFY